MGNGIFLFIVLWYQIWIFCTYVHPSRKFFSYAHVGEIFLINMMCNKLGGGGGELGPLVSRRATYPQGVPRPMGGGVEGAFSCEVKVILAFNNERALSPPLLMNNEHVG